MIFSLISRPKSRGGRWGDGGSCIYADECRLRTRGKFTLRFQPYLRSMNGVYYLYANNWATIKIPRDRVHDVIKTVSWKSRGKKKKENVHFTLKNNRITFWKVLNVGKENDSLWGYHILKNVVIKRHCCAINWSVGSFD